MRPVANLSYAVDRTFWGFSSFGFHITNAVLHLVVVGLLYGWCTRVLGPAAGQRDDVNPDWTAFFAAAVFGLHPVMSSAVGYVSARSELLAAAGFLAALTYARRAILGNNRTAGILAGVFGVLAIGASSSADALPIVVLAYDAWVLRDPGWQVRLARIYAPATLAIASVAAWQLVGSAGTVFPPRGPLESLLIGSTVVWHYLALLIVPRGQSLVHGVRWPTSIVDPISIAALVLLACGVAVAVWKRRTYPLVAFGVVWFLGVLAPSTSFVPVRDAMAEHRLYLASPGLLLAAGSLTWRAIASRRAIRISLTAVLALLAVGTYQRNELWSDPMQLWEESVRRAPDAWQAHWGYAELLREIGNCERARSEYDAVLRLYPGHAGARASLETCRQP